MEWQLEARSRQPRGVKLKIGNSTIKTCHRNFRGWSSTNPWNSARAKKSGTCWIREGNMADARMPGDPWDARKRDQRSLVASRVLVRRDCESRNFARKRIESDGPFKFKNLTIGSIQVSFLYARLYMLYTRGDLLLGRSKNSVSNFIESWSCKFKNFRLKINQSCHFCLIFTKFYTRREVLLKWKILLKRIQFSWRVGEFTGLCKFSI